jgi:hypothetical protein
MVYGQRRARLDPSRISKMAKIHFYYISNAKEQLQYYGNLLSDEEVQNHVIYATQNLTDFQEFQEESFLESSLLDEEEEIIPQLAKELVNEEELKRILEIEVCVDLSNQVFIDNDLYVNVNDNNEFVEEFVESENRNFNVEDLINQAFENE